MANDYIPRPAARFHARQNNFATYVNGHPAGLGLAAGDVVDLNNSAATWTADYLGEDRGKTAHYMLRWVARTGEMGPLSETASATIGA